MSYSDKIMLYELRFIAIGGEFLSIVSEFLCDRRQRMRFDGKVSLAVDVVPVVPQGSVLGPLFILCTSELFRIVGDHIVGYAGDAAVISRLLLYPKVIKSLNQNMAAIYSWCLK